MRSAALAIAAFVSIGLPALADDANLPSPSPLPPVIAEPRDIAYPGTIELSVDATDLDRRIFRVHESIPIPGTDTVTLLFPKWLPGNHAPRGPLASIGGLMAYAGGQRVEWVRDPVDEYAFHVKPPSGAKSIDFDFQLLSPVEKDEGRIVVTPEMLRLQWNELSIYPAGYFVRRIPVSAQVTLPSGWGFGTALDVAKREEGHVGFKTVPYDVLVDSPILAGRYFKTVDLDPGAKVPVRLDIAADRPDLLEMRPEQLDAHKTLVQQAYKLYGARHYDHYDFLLSLSDRLGGIGLEHHRSSEDGTVPGYFSDWDKSAPSRDLLPHEFTHSWDGKYRRPADLWTADYDQPMRGSLLWVYEGQTQYWGGVLAARSGLVTPQQALDSLAMTAATYDNTPGRAWKSLADTTNDPVVASRRPQPWRSWRRSEDYYSEGELIWLDADTLIRDKTGGQKSLDDFARAFYGVNDGSFTELTYRFEDVVATLNAVLPHDWEGFLKSRLEGHGPGAPLDGLMRGGYKLVYTEVQSDYQKQVNTQRKTEDFTFSLGLVVAKDQTLASVQWDGPAFKSGLTVGAKILAVNGIGYDADRLKEAITMARNSKAPIELLVQKDDHFRTYAIDYHGGLRYPHLEKQGDAPASLDAIFAAK